MSEFRAPSSIDATMARSQPNGSIYISCIALEVKEPLSPPIHHIVFKTKHKHVRKETTNGFPHKETFDPALELPTQDKLSVSVENKSGWYMFRCPAFVISVDQSDILKGAESDGYGKEKYLATHEKIEVTITFSRSNLAEEGAAAIAGEKSNDVQLSSSTDSSSDFTHLSPTAGEMLNVCPRFRLLIIGNSGVGKSSLIEKVFGVEDAKVNHTSRGFADVNHEYTAAQNDLFVVHDSLGLEAADGSNFEKLINFIDDRRKQKELKDRLHAVWVCIQVPYAKGRVLEAGMEEFLRKRKKIVGNIPIVVVLTKLDLLENLLIMDLRKQGVQIKSIDEAKPHIESQKLEFLKEFCEAPLRRAAKDDIPYVAVSRMSAKDRYKLESTISELVKTTSSEIERYIKAYPTSAEATELEGIDLSVPLYICEMAQRASIQKKVDLTITIGKRKYWSSFDACFGFSPERLEEFLFVLHQDIIQVWNFHDADGALGNKDLTKALLDTSDLGADNDNPTENVDQSPLTFVAVMIHLMNGPPMFSPMLPLDRIVAINIVCFQIHNSARDIAKCFMAYIIDLINVMRILFILAPRGSITSNDVARAIGLYKQFPFRRLIHSELKEFSARELTLLGGREQVVYKIERLVRRYDINDIEMLDLREKVEAAPGRP